MSDTTYNGWTNYATWRVNLEMFDALKAEQITGEKLPSPVELCEALKEWAELAIENSSAPGLARDYALVFLSDVNWREITNKMLIDAYCEENQPIPPDVWTRHVGA